MTSRYLHGLSEFSYSIGDWGLEEREQDGMLSITFRDTARFRLIATGNVTVLARESKWGIQKHSGFQMGLVKGGS